MARGRNDYETAQIQGRLWTPAVLRPEAWFDASNLASITNSATGVSTWADISGNARNMSRAATDYRPDLLIENRNGLSVVEFVDQGSGQGDRLNMDSSINNVITAYTALMRTARTGNNSFVFTFLSEYDWHASDTIGSALASNVYANTNWTNGANFRNGNPINVQAAGSGPLDEFAIYSFLCTGNMRTRGIGEDRIYHGTTGRYGEVLWFVDAHSTRERLLVEGYLAWKWGVPLAADHPFANRPPLIGD